ncbi:hypothetical protein MBENS4_4310 [Novosphingobium sp. MBES04]|nr:hypothetical protein MBENS4_4310 [Novosphingobium sp. MBES04]
MLTHGAPRDADQITTPKASAGRQLDAFTNFVARMQFECCKVSFGPNDVSAIALVKLINPCRMILGETSSVDAPRQETR